MSGLRDMNEMEQLANNRNLEAHLKCFYQRWAPHNPEYDQQWYAELHMLARHIQQDAQAPFVKALADAVMRSPVPFSFPAPQPKACPKCNCAPCICITNISTE